MQLTDENAQFLPARSSSTNSKPSELLRTKTIFDDRFKLRRLSFYEYKHKKHVYAFNDARLEKHLRKKNQMTCMVQNLFSLTLLFNGYFAYFYEFDKFSSREIASFPSR